MTDASGTGSTPAGGPATVAGVVYQLLWYLLRVTSFEIRQPPARTDAQPASLILEPIGGGGDARESSEHDYTVTQLKRRSGGGTWPLSQVIEDVLPDLLIGVRLDLRRPVYQFVTDGKRGDWDAVERFFRSLRSRDPGEEPSAHLDDTNPLKVGTRKSTAVTTKPPFWDKPTYTERQLFTKIVDTLHTTASDRKVLEKRVWNLLAHFELVQLSQVEAEREIDLSLAEIAEHTEQVPDLRARLVARLTDLAVQGNGKVTLGEFLPKSVSAAVPRSHVSVLASRSRTVTAARVKACGYDRSQHVQEAFTSTLTQLTSGSDYVVLTGPSGVGKSWHTWALSDALARTGSLVAHVNANSTARATLDEAAIVLWNKIKNQDLIRPFEAAVRGLPGPPPQRVLVVDQVDDPAIARDLALAGLPDSGVTLVMACSAESLEGLRRLTHLNLAVQDVQPFSPTELSDYLVARQVPGAAGIPGDVRELLAQPFLARLYCDLSRGHHWLPKSEYELLRRYWTDQLESRVYERAQALLLLRKLARSVLDGGPYPWTMEQVAELNAPPGAIDLLKDSGWLRVSSGGELSLWHDRLLNWLIAEVLVDDVMHDRRTPDQFSQLTVASLDGTLKAPGRQLRYVAMDALWLAADRRLPPRHFALALAALESSSHVSDVYADLIPTLGAHAIPGLLTRLDQHLAGSVTYRTTELMRCIASIGGPDSLAKARTLLLAEPAEHRSLALILFRRHADPDSLDRLWALHVDASGSKEWTIEYDSRMDALRKGVEARSDWLGARLKQSTPETACVSDLVYLLATAPNGEALWREIKAHLKTVVPPNKQRCLVRCITVFKDKSELDYLRSLRNEDADFVAPAALAALVRVSPETAIDDLMTSTSRYVAFTRAWHLHRLLAARPTATQAAARTLAAGLPSAVIGFYSGAENEIDANAFGLVIAAVEQALTHALAKTPVDASDGALYTALSFVDKACRPDLLQQVKDQRGTALDEALARYLEQIGPRDHVSGRLCDGPAFSMLEYMGATEIEGLILKGLNAHSWYAHIDAIDDAHKHGTTAVVARLRELASDEQQGENRQFVAYEATNALCLLEDWSSLIPLAVERGLGVSPYLIEHRIGRPPLNGPFVDSVRASLMSGDRSPGLLLAAGLSRNDDLSRFAVETLGAKGSTRDQVLAAALAAHLLGATDQAVAGIALHLNDQTLTERLGGLLLDVKSDQALAAVYQHLQNNFDLGLCSALGRHTSYAERAASLIWQNVDTLQRSLYFYDALSLLGNLANQSARAFLERMAFDVGLQGPRGSVQVPAIEGVAIFDMARAFTAAEMALRDPLCSVRDQIPALLVRLNAVESVSVLEEVFRTADDELLKLSIVRAFPANNVPALVSSLLTSEDTRVRRLGCLMAGQHPVPQELISRIRELVLDEDESLSSAAVSAIRQHIRLEAVKSLADAASKASLADRWILLDRAAQHARGDKDRPNVGHWALQTLVGTLSPLEAKRFHEQLRRGSKAFNDAASDRMKRKRGR